MKILISPGRGLLAALVAITALALPDSAAAASSSSVHALSTAQARDVTLAVLRVQGGIDLFMSMSVLNHIEGAVAAQTTDGRISGSGSFDRTQADLAGTLVTSWHGPVDAENGAPVAADLHVKTVAQTDMTIDVPGTGAPTATMERGSAITYRYDWDTTGYHQYGSTQNVKAEAQSGDLDVNMNFQAGFSTVVVGSPFGGGSIDTSFDTTAVTHSAYGTHVVGIELTASPGLGGRTLKSSRVTIDGQVTDVGLTAADL